MAATPSPRRSPMKSRQSSKADVISYLLKNKALRDFSAQELARLPLSVLLTEKTSIEKQERDGKSPEALTAIDFILRDPHNFFSRSDLELMCDEDLVNEEAQLREKTRFAAQHSIIQILTL